MNCFPRSLYAGLDLLKPQLASNWDATLEYYFEPVGQFSAGWFQKTIKDYIVSGVISGTVPTGSDNGYNGDFGGYTILTSSNGGTAYVQGWELTYQQQFTFVQIGAPSRTHIRRYRVLPLSFS